MSSASQSVGPQSKVLLVDGHSLAYRAFYALPVENFQAPDGQPTNAIHGFVSMLLQVIESEQPTHVAVAFDVSRQTFRRAEFPDYKANRAKSPIEFSSQVPVIKDVLDAFGVTHLAVDGFEADDIIATLALAAAEQLAEVNILTGDRDSLQLVNEHITVLYPTKGVKELSRLTPAAVEAKYGVRPDQYADFAALRGDASDNLPSIPGVGEKTAASWLRTYGTLQDLLSHASEVKGKVGDGLREHAAQVLLNRRLTQLVHDVPLNATVHDLHRHLGDRSKIGEIFDRLGFRQLRQRAIATFVAETAAADEPAIALPASRSFTAVGWTPGRLADTLQTIDRVQPVFVAAHVSGVSTLTHIALAWQDSFVVLDCAQFKNDDFGNLAVFLSDPQRHLIAHGAKPLARAMARNKVMVNSVSVDTELWQYILHPGLRGLDLASTYERLLHREIATASGGDLFAESGSDVGIQAQATAEVHDALANGLSEQVRKLHDDIELPTLKVLAVMESAGIAVDVAHLRRILSNFEASMAAAEAMAHEAAGTTFNVGSPKQLQEVLFEKRGLPKTKKNKTGYTTDAEALTWLFESTHDAVVEAILQWREVSKLKQTVASLLPLVSSDGRIHTTFLQTVAATGRLSSVDPNLQNIPVRTAEGRLIRQAFVHGADFDVLLTADYSQIEMRIMAHLSQDEGLIQAFTSGEDLHTTVASQVFDVPGAEVTPDMRRRIKAMSYGLAYGLSSYGLAQQLGIEPREATALMDSYFERFGGVRDYLRDVVKRASQDGYTETMFGRRRYLPDLASTNQQARAVAERMALNAPIQGTAADIMKIAMLRVHEGIEAAGLTSRLLLQVHDELVLEVKEEELPVLEAIVRAGMSSACDLLVPLEVSVGIGRNWDEAAH